MIPHPFETNQSTLLVSHYWQEVENAIRILYSFLTFCVGNILLDVVMDVVAVMEAIFQEALNAFMKCRTHLLLCV